MEGDVFSRRLSARRGISIHALRVEGDPGTHHNNHLVRKISIHALRVEGDRVESALSSLFWISIHALRVEGDRGYDNGVVISYDFYPRPPGGGRLPLSVSSRYSGRISIHALRVEGDASC